MRIGFGYDVHRLKKGRKCILCGVEIPCDFGPDGHSDADAPVHALIDALLGAAALGDIGRYFPDSDAKWNNADSIEMLKQAYRLVKSAGLSFGNADMTIVIESPKLSPYIEQMRTRIAKAIGTDTGYISVKATTEEKLGFTGKREGLSAFAVVLLESQSSDLHNSD